MEQIHSARNLVAKARQGLWLLWLLLLLLAAACGDLTLARGLVSRASHLDGGLVTLLQLLADLVEGEELPPACLDSAGPRDTMAFASGLHSSLNYLFRHNEIKANWLFC